MKARRSVTLPLVLVNPALTHGLFAPTHQTGVSKISWLVSGRRLNSKKKKLQPPTKE